MGGGKQIIYLVRVPVELCIYVCPVDQGEGGCFPPPPPFGDTSIFFPFVFWGFFFGEREEGGGGGGGGKGHNSDCPHTYGGCICRLMCGVGLGRGFFILFLANYCAEDLIGCGTLPLAKFYFLFFLLNSFGYHFLF